MFTITDPGVHHGPIGVFTMIRSGRSRWAETRNFAKLLTFYAFPAEHWKHLRTTNVIESPFATVRLRQRVKKGAGSRTKAITMAFKLLEMAQLRWRRLNGPALLPLVANGVKYEDGVQLERWEDRAV